MGLNSPFNGFNTYHGQAAIIHKLADSRSGSSSLAATNWMLIGMHACMHIEADADDFHCCAQSQ